MVELDFNEIDSILQEFDFSNEFINDYKKRYQTCSTNLFKLTYQEYSNFDDIDQMDEIGCLIQSYFWFKDSWESFETYDIINTSLLSKTKLFATVELGYKDSDDYDDSLNYTLIKENDKWLINKIE